jgi:hypothetical protein
LEIQQEEAERAARLAAEEAAAAAAAPPGVLTPAGGWAKAARGGMSGGRWVAVKGVKVQVERHLARCVIQVETECEMLATNWLHLPPCGRHCADQCTCLLAPTGAA